MTNQRRIGLIVLALLVLVLGAFGVDQLAKGSTEPAAIASDVSNGSAELDYEDEMALDEDFDADMSGDEMALDEDISPEELALWEECAAKFDDASTEELAADDPCAALEADFADEDDFGDYDGEMVDEAYLGDLDGEIMEAGFYDDFSGFGEAFGMDDGYGFDEGYAGDEFDEGYGMDEGYDGEYAEGGLEDAGWIALSVLGFLFEAALIGAVAAGVIIWFQRRQSSPPAKK